MRRSALALLFLLLLAPPACAGNSYSVGDEHGDASFSGVSDWPTMTAWIRMTDTPPASAPNTNIVRFTSGNEFKLRCVWNGGDGGMQIHAVYKACTSTSSPTVIADASWHFVAAVFDGSGGQAWLDTTEFATDTHDGFFTTPTGLVIGDHYSNVTEIEVADVAVWEATLTDQEVVALANGYPPHMLRTNELRFYYPMSHGEGTGNLVPHVDTTGSTMAATGSPSACGSPPQVHWPRPHYSHLSTDRARQLALWAADHAYRRDGYAIA